MRQAGKYLLSALLGGLLILAPLYLSALLIGKAMQSVAAAVRPLAKLLPGWLPAEQVLSCAMVLVLCLLVGMAAGGRFGRDLKARLENSLLHKVPGYVLFRGLTQQVCGDHEELSWKPALVEIEEALVPAFIIEKLEDGRLTVFVPSAPAPVSGAIYVLDPERVHLLDIPIARAVKVLSQWGLGSKELVATMSDRSASIRHRVDA
jgi:uncharacterized membrane protein